VPRGAHNTRLSVVEAFIKSNVQIAQYFLPAFCNWLRITLCRYLVERRVPQTNSPLPLKKAVTGYLLCNSKEEPTAFTKLVAG
jgi:hypothetical protein